MRVVYCPNCNQKVMVYRRSIRVDMLAALAKAAESAESFKVSDFDFNKGVNADFTKMKFWGLISDMGHNTWKVSGLAYEFLAGKIQIPKYVYIYNDKNQGDPDSERSPLIYANEIDENFISRDYALRYATPLKIFGHPEFNFNKKEAA